MSLPFYRFAKTAKPGIPPLLARPASQPPELLRAPPAKTVPATWKAPRTPQASGTGVSTYRIPGGGTRSFAQSRRFKDNPVRSADQQRYTALGKGNFGLNGVSNAGSTAAFNNFPMTRPGQSRSVEQFQSDMEQLNPGSVQRARDKADAGSYSARGIQPPTYANGFVPTNEEQAKRMGVYAGPGQFVNPETWKAPTKRHRGYAYAKNETTGVEAKPVPTYAIPDRNPQLRKADTTPGYAFPNRKIGSDNSVRADTIQNIASSILLSQVLHKLADAQLAPKPVTAKLPALPKPSRDWSQVPNKPVTYQGQAVDTTPSAARLARDQASQKLIQQNSDTIQRGQQATQQLQNKVQDTRQAVDQARTQHTSEMGEIYGRLNQAGKTVGVAPSAQPELERSAPPQRRTVSQLENMYKAYGIGSRYSSPQALEATVDEAGQATRADNEKYLMTSRTRRQRIERQLARMRAQNRLRKTAEDESGVSTFWKW